MTNKILLLITMAPITSFHYCLVRIQLKFNREKFNIPLKPAHHTVIPCAVAVERDTKMIQSSIFLVAILLSLGIF